MSAFLQSYSQSQARLKFVTTLGMDNFDCNKMNAYFKKNSQLDYGKVSFTIGRNSPTSPPYVTKQLTAVFHTQPPFSSLVSQATPFALSIWVAECSINDKLHIVVN